MVLSTLLYYFYDDGDVDDERARWKAQWLRARSRFVESQIQTQGSSISIVWIKHLTQYLLSHYWLSES